jgi:catechol 2,3-dioxygenase-like lactoylglutathione lyase family enzyme
MQYYHTFLGVTDAKRSLEFYLKAFEGSKVTKEFEIDGNHMYIVDLNNGIVFEMLELPQETVKEHVVDVKGPMPYVDYSGIFQHLAIQFDSKEEITAQYERLVAAGCGVIRPLNFGFLIHGLNGHPDFYGNGAHVTGPDGEIIELCWDVDV